MGDHAAVLVDLDGVAALQACAVGPSVAHKHPPLVALIAASRDWLTSYYLPPYAPTPWTNWSLLRHGWLFNVAFSTPEHLVQRIRCGLRHIQYRSDLIDG